MSLLKKTVLFSGAALALVCSANAARADEVIPPICLNAAKAALSEEAGSFVKDKIDPSEGGLAVVEMTPIGAYKGFRFYLHGSARIPVVAGKFTGQKPGVSAFVTLDLLRVEGGEEFCSVSNLERSGTFPFGN